MRRYITFMLTGLLIIGIAGCNNSSDKNQKEQTPMADSLSRNDSRQSLEGMVNLFLDAMVAGSPSKAPFSKDARYTENAEEISLADISKGLWKNTAGLTDYKFYVCDPEAGQVAFVGLIRIKGQEEKPGLLTLRLKVENREISEAEAIFVESIMGGNGGAMTVPPAAYSEPLPPEEQVSREDLIKITNEYFDSIELSNGKIVPWHDECYRLENGMWTAGPKLPPELAAHMNEPETPQPDPEGETSVAFARGPCTEAIDSGVFSLIESIQPRRTPVVDVERGVTWGVYMFNHPGVETITMPDGSTQPAAYFAGQPNSMPMSELFKIKGGKIRDIMAIGVIREYRSNSGWK